MPFGLLFYTQVPFPPCLFLFFFLSFFKFFLEYHADMFKLKIYRMQYFISKIP